MRGARIGAAGRALYLEKYTPESYLERYVDAALPLSRASTTQ